ncbi:hypothetical protein [Chitinophaga tropicalis]|uniref:Uncharacterized protein n=1 Tax=Chitinophaga tropicalis TaxID=2683588 RepID=A0A7K1U055_9BACT|nr:hypothetical protein [Chitinophaga tropicalis]MVT07749.1 hypothetical protein [Chitinophaga tropicalis]
MRQLSNGYGFIHNQQAGEAYILSPAGVAAWQSSCQSLDNAKQLASGGKGVILTAKKMKGLTEATKEYVLLSGR